MKTACFIGENLYKLHYIYSDERIARIKERVHLIEPIITSATLEQNKEKTKEVEIIFAGWETTKLTENEIDTYFPNLKIFFYAAGSVHYFAENLFKKNIMVVNAATAMAIPVAQFTLSLIIQLAKGADFVFENYKKLGYKKARAISFTEFPGLYDGTIIGILGVGKIGTALIQYLQYFDVKIKVYDPFLSEERAKDLHVEKTTLEDIFTTAQVITNHLANNEQTVGLLNYSLFSLMKKNAAFINTGRGAQVIEEDLARALQEEPLRYAVIDVTKEEPYPSNGILWTCNNLRILPHISGFAAQEVHTLSDCIIGQLDQYLEGKRPDNTINVKNLETMA